MQPAKKAAKKGHLPEKKNPWDYCASSPWVYLIIFASVFLIYGQVLSFSLGKLDEPDILILNKKLLADFGNLGDVFFRDAFFSAKNCTFYRPLQNVSFMIDAHLSGSGAWGYYLTNILIHAVTCSLLFYLLGQLGKERKVAMWAALFFTVSPLFVQAIAWAPSRGDLLIAMFGLASLVFFIRYLRSHKYPDLIAHLAALALAVFSKETALVFPVLFISFYFLIAEERKVSLYGLILPVVFYSLIAGSYLFLRSMVVDMAIPSSVFGILPLLNNLRTIPEFISKFFLPAGLSPMPGFGWFPTLAGIALIGLLAFLVIKYLPGSPGQAYFGSLWFLLFTIPGMMYTHPMGQAAYDYLEQRAYLPLIGVVIIMYFILLRVSGMKKSGAFPLIILVVCAVYGTYAHAYAENYSNPIAFYNRAVETNPNSAVACFNRGEIAVLYEKDYSRALQDFNRALQIRSDYSKALVNRGICRQFQGDTAGALKDCETAANLEPGLFIAHKNIAVIKTQLGLTREAINEWDVALNISPDYYQGFNARGVLKYQLKDFPAAEKDFNACLKISSSYPEGYLNRGLVYYMMNDLDRACNDWQYAAQLGSGPAFNLVESYCKK